MVNKLSMRLASGEMVTLTGGDAERQLLQELWQINRRGAVATIVKLRDARRIRPGARLVVLDEHESTALREALTIVPSALTE